MSSPALLRARQRGRQAYADGRPVSSNPYAAQALRNEFRDAWTAARNEGIAPQPQPETISDAEIISRQAARIRDLVSENSRLKRVQAEMVNALQLAKAAIDKNMPSTVFAPRLAIREALSKAEEGGVS